MNISDPLIQNDDDSFVTQSFKTHYRKKAYTV